jgi:hypothetical protein
LGDGLITRLMTKSQHQCDDPPDDRSPKKDVDHDDDQQVRVPPPEGNQRGKGVHGEGGQYDEPNHPSRKAVRNDPHIRLLSGESPTIPPFLQSRHLSIAAAVRIVGLSSSSRNARRFPCRVIPCAVVPPSRKAGQATVVKVELPTGKRPSPPWPGLLRFAWGLGGGDDPASTPTPTDLKTRAVLGHPRA